MPKYPKNLFESEPSAWKWGVTPGGHVAHVIDPKTTPAFTEISQETMEADKYGNHSYDAKKVSQAEAYNNAGDNMTAGAYLQLAETAAKEYARPEIPDAYRDVLLKLKEVVTVGGRQAQQDAIRSFNKQAAALMSKTDDPQIKAGLTSLMGGLGGVNQGTLDPKDYTYDKKSIKEPGNTVWGKFGVWTASNDVLFPHEPSPNDIKQGYGVQDCFLMAPLLRQAATDPKKIKDAMKDNGDGTVTVRFFKDGKHLKDPKEPVFVTVNKTVNKLAGKANVYASSSLWVQMMEKAYIEFLSKEGESLSAWTGKTYNHSYADINRANPHMVLNALDGEKKYSAGEKSFGFAVDEEAYKPGAPKAEKYKALEDEMFQLLHEEVNLKKGNVVLGNSGTVGKNASFAKDHGIRTGHAYAVMGVFEQDGKKYVQVRDPYAMFRSKYDKDGKLVNDQAMLGGTGKAGVSNMGTFNLEMKDFLQTFDSVLGMEENAYGKLADISMKWYKAAAPQKESKAAEGKGFLDDGFDVLDEEGNVVEQPAEKPAEKAAEGKDLADDDFEVLDSKGNVVENPAEKVIIKPQMNPEESDMDFEDLGDGLDLDDDSPEETVEQPEAADGFEDFEELEKPYSEALMDVLKEPNGRQRVAEMVKELADDLEKTAMFFSFKNTKNFTVMRDQLNSVNKKLQGNQYGEDAKGLEDLATELTALSEAAETYANSKLESVKATIDSKKEPSLRAMHRLADAVSLMGLKDGNLGIAQNELGYAESLQIVKSDLSTMLRKSGPGVKPSAVEAAAKAMAAVDTHIKNDRALQEQFELVKPSAGDFVDQSKLRQMQNTQQVQKAPGPHSLG